MTATIVWITGGSSGIGRALVETVPYPDARVIDISRSGGAPGAEHVPADLADPAAWAAVEAHLYAQLGAFDGERAVFLHCAGTLNPIGFAGEANSAAYRQAVLLNAAAPQALGHAFLGAVEAAGCAGDLVLLSSGAARTPYEGWSHYSAGKAAVDQWVRVAGAERTRRGQPVRVLAVGPGVVATAMQEQIRATDASDFPQVERFRTFFEQGALSDPKDAALGIWSLLDSDSPSGTVVDLRSR